MSNPENTAKTESGYTGSLAADLLDRESQIEARDELVALVVSDDNLTFGPVGPMRETVEPISPR